MTEEAVDAGRRTADTWCGLKEVEWWVVSMAAMASAPMVVVVGMASMVAVASLNRRSRLGPVVLVLKMEVVTEARRNTKGKGSLSMTCWSMTSLRKWLCLLTVMAPKVMFGSLLLGPISSKMVTSRRWGPRSRPR